MLTFKIRFKAITILLLTRIVIVLHHVFMLLINILLFIPMLLSKKQYVIYSHILNKELKDFNKHGNNQKQRR